MKHTVFIICIAVFLGIIITLFSQTSSSAKGFSSSYPSKSITIHDSKFVLRVADTEIRREQGLSGIENMAENEGMLFIFPKPETYSFWMKDMKFPLDFIYINGDKVVDLKHNISPSTYPQTFVPKSASDKIIELNAGILAMSGIKIGDTVYLTK